MLPIKRVPYVTFHYDKDNIEKHRYLLECGDNDNEDCLISACYSEQRVWLQCLPTCEEGFYLDQNIPQYLVCTQGSTSQKNSEKCNCLAGSYWSYEQCKECPKNTYSLSSATECKDCQEHFSYAPGSSHCKCNCTAGYYHSSSEQCSQCQEGYFTYEGSTKCTKCPNGSVSFSHKANCGCPNGKFWNTSKSDCDLCLESKTECVDCQESFPSSDVSSCFTFTSEQSNETTEEVINIALILQF